MKSIINTQGNDNATIPDPVTPGINVAFRLAAIVICLSTADFGTMSLRSPEFAPTLLFYAAIIYLLLTTLVSYQRESVDPNPEVGYRLGYLDSLVLGAILLLLPFTIVTPLALLTVIAIRATATGGPTLLFGHLCFTVLGSVVAFSVLRPETPVLHGTMANLLPLVVAFLFVTFVVSRMFLRDDRLTSTFQQLSVNNIQLKLNNYKLAKYLSPSLRKAIFSGKRVTLETQRKRVTVFFSDIKGFSELSEELEADTLTSMLNFYLTEMSDIALKFGGTVDKFIGDAIMVFFGDPVTRGAKEDCIACVSMALAMQKRMIDLNKRWASQGIRKPLNVRMGINTGYCTVGNFGTENRLDYTLLGTEVNKASRLESAADAGEILISRQTYELIKDTILCEPHGHVPLKGYKAPVEVFSVIDLRANLGMEGSQCVEHSTEGFSMFLDVESVPHLQKHRILSSLEDAYEQLRKDIEFNTRNDVKIFK